MIATKDTPVFSFIWFLNKYGITYRDKITQEVLTGIILLVVVKSNLKDKDRIMWLILMMLKK